jgi:hypothetical protein
VDWKNSQKQPTIKVDGVFSPVVAKAIMLTTGILTLPLMTLETCCECAPGWTNSTDHSYCSSAESSTGQCVLSGSALCLTMVFCTIAYAENFRSTIAIIVAVKQHWFPVAAACLSSYGVVVLTVSAKNIDKATFLVNEPAFFSVKSWNIFFACVVTVGTLSLSYVVFSQYHRRRASIKYAKELIMTDQHKYDREWDRVTSDLLVKEAFTELDNPTGEFKWLTDGNRKKLEPIQPAKEVSMLFELADLLNPWYQQMVAGWQSRALGIPVGQYISASVKNPTRAFEKIRRTYLGRCERLCDLVRASVVCHTVDQVRALLVQISDDHRVQVVRCKNRFALTKEKAAASGGYRDLQLLLVTSGFALADNQRTTENEGKVGLCQRYHVEMQIHLGPMYAIKTEQVDYAFSALPVHPRRCRRNVAVGRSPPNDTDHEPLMVSDDTAFFANAEGGAGTNNDDEDEPASKGICDFFASCLVILWPFGLAERCVQALVFFGFIEKKRNTCDETLTHSGHKRYVKFRTIMGK